MFPIIIKSPAVALIHLAFVASPPPVTNILPLIVNVRGPVFDINILPSKLVWFTVIFGTVMVKLPVPEWLITGDMALFNVVLFEHVNEASPEACVMVIKFAAPSPKLFILPLILPLLKLNDPPVVTPAADVLFKENNDYKLEKIPDVSTYRAYNIGIPERTILKTICNVKIKSFQESADLFGYKPTKEFMMKSAQQFEIGNVMIDYTCKKDGEIRSVVEVIFKDKALKFLPEDLEFIYPDLELLRKGYTEPLDRKIKKGSKVKVVDDRRIPFKKNTKLKVNTVITVGHSSFSRKYCSVLNDYKEYLIPIKKLKVVA